MLTPRFLDAPTCLDLRARLDAAIAAPDGDAQAAQLLSLQRATMHTMGIYSRLCQAQAEAQATEGL